VSSVNPVDLEDGGGTVDELMGWWIDRFLRRAASDTAASSIRKHIIGSGFGKLLLREVTAGKIDLFLSEKEDDLSARSVNHLRGYLSRAFTMARRMERFPRPNPVVDVPKRKVVKRLPDYLRPHEVRPLIASLKPKWKPLFATALYTGMRKGELFALRKEDIDFDAGVIMVSRSHERDIPKGGRVEAVPINRELVPYLERAMTASLSELVFPNDDGTMLPKHTALEHVLRRAMRRAGLVTGYVHKCRRHGCGHREAAPHANPIDCPKCDFRLFPVGQVRKIRFHHLRHSTASLLLMKGADLAAVQRIMRHQDPRITTEVYGHLQTTYLRSQIERLRFGPEPADLSSGGRPSRDADRQRSRLAAGDASEPPSPADTSGPLRLPAPLTPHLLPESRTAPGATCARVAPPGDEVPGRGHIAPGTAPRVRTTPTMADLVSYWGGRYRLLRVKEAAEQLAVPTWRIYQLCEDGGLPHVRITNSIRIRPDDLQEFIASSVTAPERRRAHRRRKSSE
jgi:integrase